MEENERHKRNTRAVSEAARRTLARALAYDAQDQTLLNGRKVGSERKVFFRRHLDLIKSLKRRKGR